MFLQVFGHVRTLDALVVADGARIALLSCVSHHVVTECSRLLEPHLADGALKRFLTSVLTLVDDQHCPESALIVALAALEWLFPCVNHVVLPEAVYILEALSAFVARMVPDLTVLPVQVTVELCLRKEDLGTKVALIGLLQAAVVPLLMKTQSSRSVELFTAVLAKEYHKRVGFDVGL